MPISYWDRVEHTPDCIKCEVGIYNYTDKCEKCYARRNYDDLGKDYKRVDKWDARNSEASTLQKIFNFFGELGEELMSHPEDWKPPFFGGAGYDHEEEEEKCDKCKGTGKIKKEKN